MGFFQWLFGKRRETKSELRPAFEVRTGGPDPGVVASVDALLREANDLPIGAVREHAIAHIKVSLQGDYFLNGKQTSLEELQRECARLARIRGLVFYYRENPMEEPPSQAEAVIRAATQARLPLTFAARDYDPEVKVADYFLPAGSW